MRNAANEPYDPYGSDWLFKVKPLRLASNLRQLETGAAARRLMDDAAAVLARRADPRMAAVLQDGGVPVHGIAAALVVTTGTGSPANSCAIRNGRSGF